MNRLKVAKRQNETARANLSELKNLVEQERVVRRECVCDTAASLPNDIT